MGQIGIATKPVRLSAVLGSCVGVALYHQRLGLGVLGHVVLPESNGRAGLPGKFADTACEHMLQVLKQRSAFAPGLVAKIAGGARMFGVSGPMQIGEDNVEAAARRLEAAGVRIAAKDVGGTSGRRISLDCGTGMLTVEIVGKPPRTL